MIPISETLSSFGTCYKLAQEASLVHIALQNYSYKVYFTNCLRSLLLNTNLTRIATFNYLSCKYL